MNNKHLNNCLPLQLSGNVDSVHRVRIKSIKPENMEIQGCGLISILKTLFGNIELRISYLTLFENMSPKRFFPRSHNFELGNVDCGYLALYLLPAAIPVNLDKESNC